ncbi:DUF943 family protein [Enterobacter sp. C2]|uniref:DUF943 family protein n=1 Tax=Enterobacter sp. C2 TaxID=2870346 RepID=UPI001CA398CB|nr:DUF943 family protein [Enterobacter sp. C2]
MRYGTAISAGLLLLIAAYTAFRLSLPPKVVGIHRDGSYIDVLVENFPYTDQGKITWWQNNSSMMREYFNIPSASGNGQYHISFWDFNEGYKPIGKYDRLCFEDFKVNANCIDKNKLMEVVSNKDGQVSILTDERYELENGKFLKIRK